MSWYSKSVAAVLFAWLAATGTGAAQLSKPQFGVAAGATFPQGGVGCQCGLNGFKTGWQGMAFVAFPIGHSPLALRLNGSYGANTSSEPINDAPAEKRIGLLGADADLTFTFVSRYSPASPKVYLLVGPGLYRVYNRLTYYNCSGQFCSSADTKFAYNLGGGLDVGALFFEIRYVHVDGFGNSISYVFLPITAGIRFGSR